MISKHANQIFLYSSVVVVGIASIAAAVAATGATAPSPNSIAASSSQRRQVLVAGNTFLAAKITRP